MNTPKREDDDDLLIGNRAMADFSTGEGFPISISTMQKYTSPAINTGPDLIGYYGKKPASTKGLVRAWCRSRIRPVQSAAAGSGDRLAEACINADPGNRGRAARHPAVRRGIIARREWLGPRRR